VFSGGFIAGDQEAVARLHRLHYHKFAHLVERERNLDDDQVHINLAAIFKKYYADFVGSSGQ